VVGYVFGVTGYDLDPIPQLIVEVVLEEAPYQFIPGHWVRTGKIRSGASRRESSVGMCSQSTDAESQRRGFRSE
jgi:hypothetical protein